MSQDIEIIRMPEVVRITGLSVTTINRKIREGDFPNRIKLGKHASGWIKSDVQTWILRKAGREPANDSQPQAA